MRIIRFFTVLAVMAVSAAAASAQISLGGSSIEPLGAETEIVDLSSPAGSGSLLVYGTPAMLLLVEKTAVALLEGHLDEGMTTVGTNLNVDHVSATPLDAEVSCQVELTEIDRKRLVFSVEVKDAAGVIGKGTHERFIVQADKFQQKANSKFQA